MEVPSGKTYTRTGPHLSRFWVETPRSAGKRDSTAAIKLLDLEAAFYTTLALRIYLRVCSMLLNKRGTFRFSGFHAETRSLRTISTRGGHLANSTRGCGGGQHAWECGVFVWSVCMCAEDVPGTCKTQKTWSVDSSNFFSKFLFIGLSYVKGFQATSNFSARKKIKLLFHFTLDLLFSSVIFFLFLFQNY